MKTINIKYILHLFPTWEHFIPSVGIIGSQRGNKKLILTLETSEKEKKLFFGKSLISPVKALKAL